jgi:DNA-binding XRE family transcriptional regulator
MDYLPDSRVLTSADKAERRALLMAFGANLRRARLSAGITQRDLAVRAEFSSATVASQLEVGTRPPNFLQLVMLGHALDMPHDALLSHLPFPLRERSTRLMLALVRVGVTPPRRITGDCRLAQRSRMRTALGVRQRLALFHGPRLRPTRPALIDADPLLRRSTLFGSRARRDAETS